MEPGTLGRIKRQAAIEFSVSPGDENNGDH
jgi:hypothetical protein